VVAAGQEILVGGHTGGSESAGRVVVRDDTVVSEIEVGGAPISSDPKPTPPLLHSGTHEIQNFTLRRPRRVRVRSGVL